jgi:hypothetical protein
MLTKKQLLSKINKLAWNGEWKDAINIIKLNKLTFTRAEATEVVDNVGIDARYSFVKLFVKYGGIFPNVTIQFAKNVIKDKNSDLYKIVSKIPDWLKGLKFVIRQTK